MRYFLFLPLLLLLACKGSSDSAPAETTDQIYGEWYYENPKSTSTSVTGFTLKIEANGNIELMDGYMNQVGSTWQAYMRKWVGTYKKTDDAFYVDYTYETCDPIGKEKLYLNVVSGKLMVQNFDKSSQHSLTRLPANSPVKTANYVEDKGCNILSKLEKVSKRIPASVKSKSFLDRLVR